MRLAQRKIRIPASFTRVCFGSLLPWSPDSGTLASARLFGPAVFVNGEARQPKRRLRLCLGGG